MTDMENTGYRFKAGRNIAIKVPVHQYDRTVQFYRDIIGLKQKSDEEPETVFEFGDKNLWIDKASHLSQAEIWLELACSDVAQAKKHLDSHNIVRRDEIETLPDGFEGFWISGPGDIIHLISKG